MTPTPRTLAGTAGLLAGLLVLSGCVTDPSHSEDAEDLQRTLEGLAGVESADLDYVEPELLDAADVDLEVRMARDAAPEDVAAVFEAAYAGLTDEHRTEEGNLVVRYGDDRLELRTFESVAGAPDVAAAALVGARQARDYRRSFVRVNTQEVTREPHVESLFLVRLPRGTSRLGASAVRSAIEDAYDGLLATVDVRVPRSRP